MLGLFVITLFLSSSLLFLVQPMFAKMVLPLLGGTPAVWNTCMVFFQAALLAGYAYAHLATKYLGVRRQAMLHCVVLLLPLLVLPLVVPEGWVPPMEGNPLGWLLLLLAVAIGLPFFVVSSSAPLLQKWFSVTSHRTAKDPYYLYAASNLGSMLALLAYPTLVEPMLGLGEQSWMWSGGYVLLVGLFFVCAITVRKPSREFEALSPAPGRGKTNEADSSSILHDRPLTLRRRLRWIALAAVPSSLMLGVTTYITTDIAVVPLLWVIPLALYLLTFILVFARRRLLSHRWVVRVFPIAAVILLLVLLSEATEPVVLVTCGHLLAFFLAAMVCHGELADDRPDTSHLTVFYLLMSVGGVLGGIFNAMVAPLIFTSIAEYPVALVAVCVLSPPYRTMFPKATSDFTTKIAGRAKTFFGEVLPGFFVQHWPRLADVILPSLLGGIVAGLVLKANSMVFSSDMQRMAMIGAGPALVCFLFSERPLRFGLAIAAVLLAGRLSTAHHGTLLESHRSFFGVHRITRFHRWVASDHPGIKLNLLYHGTTMHGKQHIDLHTEEPINPEQPLAYYHRKGPIGQVFRAYQEVDRLHRVGLIGLGTGGLMAYGKAGDRYTCYEIDPVVEHIAADSGWFTYLSDAKRRGLEIDIVLGDARLTLADADDASFELLVLDAFSSDAIPVHLLTKEAVDMYLGKLDEGGLLAFHISNRYLDLDPVMAGLAGALGLTCAIQHDLSVGEDEMRREDRIKSRWAVMARHPDDLAPLNPDGIGSPWRTTTPDPDFRVWTDDFSNILSVFMW